MPSGSSPSSKRPHSPTRQREARERVLSSLRLAEQLGAETVTLNGTNIAESLLRYARSRNVSKIVIGKQSGPLWKRLLRGSVLDDLIAASGEIEIYAISGEPGPPLRVAPMPSRPKPPAWREYAMAGRGGRGMHAAVARRCARR